MYGFIPNATTENAASPPPENRSSSPKIGLPSRKLASCALSMPGTGTDASSRNTMSRPRT